MAKNAPKPNVQPSPKVVGPTVPAQPKPRIIDNPPAPTVEAANANSEQAVNEANSAT